VFNGLSACLSGPKPVLLAALSGGADSTALVAALAAVRDKLNAQGVAAAPFDLHCLHVNHGIRSPESSGADQTAAAELCKALGIPFSVTAIPPGTIDGYAKNHGTGIEGAARHFRHAALREEARRLGATAILVAHTASDRLETILMAFLRGASPAGLGAMSSYSSPAESEPTGTGADEEAIPIVRPLLSMDRAAVLAYLKQRELSFRTDETNANEKFLRNKVRLRLIPFLDDNFPGWREPVRRLGETQAMTADFLRDEAARRLPWQTDNPPAFFQAPCSQTAALGIPVDKFFSQPDVLREEALFGAIDLLTQGEEAGKKPRREILRTFARGEERAADLGACRIENNKGRVVVKKTGKAVSAAGFSVLIKKPGVYKLKGLTVKASSVQADSSREETGFFAGFPLALRSSSGDTILAEKRQDAKNSAWFTVQLTEQLDGGLDAGSE